MRSESQNRRMIAAITALVFTVLPVAASAAVPDAFLGTWVRVEREQDDAARDAMIVRATEPMSFAFRSFARGVIRRRMVPTERYVIEEVAGVAQIRNDKGVVVPLDGRPRVFDSQREVTSRVTETGGIEQIWKEGADSHGVTTWKLEPDGRLVVSQRVVDPHFAEPLEYATTYRRAS